MRLIRGILLCIAMAIALAPAVADACAALFSPEAQVRQSAQRIIFTVDRQTRTVEAYVAVNYVGAAEDFAWVVPMPSNPTVEVTTSELFDAIDSATRPVFLFPPKSCLQPNLLPGAVGGAAPEGAPGSVQVYQQGQVGPYDFSVVGGDDSGELTTWLRDNGYRITTAMEPLIKAYTDERMLFLAMKLQGGKEAGDIEPVRMTFEAEKAMIPLRLAAVGAEPNTLLQVWVFADQQVVPENMERVVIPDDQVVVTSFSGASSYDTVVSEAIAAADGRALVVEYAQPTSVLDARGNEQLLDLKGRFGYMTRFYGRLSPEQMTVDPSFAPADGLADITNVHDYRNRVSPYDCSRSDVLPAGEQVVRRNTPLGFWISYRWAMACVLIPLVALAVLTAGVIRLVQRQRQAQ